MGHNILTYISLFHVQSNNYPGDFNILINVIFIAAYTGLHMNIGKTYFREPSLLFFENNAPTIGKSAVKNVVL